MTRERTRVFGLKSKLDDCNVSFKNNVLYEVAISGEGGDKGPNELLANGRMPLHETARNLNRHILRVVRHDAVLIGSAPRGVILDHERFDIIEGSECSNGRHGSLEHQNSRPSRHYRLFCDLRRCCSEKTDLCGSLLVIRGSERIISNKCM